MSNDHVDPAFRGVLAMFDTVFGPPEKVIAAVREHERLADLAESQHALFDEWDDGMMHDVIGRKRLLKPIQDLLISRAQIKTTIGSFGINDAERVLQLLLPELDKLYEACVEEWNDK